MAEQFHYPPEVFNLLVNTIPLLCRSKPSVIFFLKGAGVAQEDLIEVSQIVSENRDSISKYDIVRNVLTRLNERGDTGLRPRREIIRRVTEFENFDTCWDNDRLKAKGLVAELRSTVNVKDSFTRMRRERDAEREQMLARQRAERTEAAKRRAQIKNVSERLSALFCMDDKPQERGTLLEAVLNELFKSYGIHVRENFRRKSKDSEAVVEQIDGVIEFDGEIYLVEMKWLKAPVGMADFTPHVHRLFMRANARGIFISASGYTEPALDAAKEVQAHKTIFLCSLHEFVVLCERQGDMIALLRKKSQAAIIEKNPYVEVFG